MRPPSCRCPTTGSRTIASTLCATPASISACRLFPPTRSSTPKGFSPRPAGLGVARRSGHHGPRRAYRSGRAAAQPPRRSGMSLAHRRHGEDEPRRRHTLARSRWPDWPGSNHKTSRSSASTSTWRADQHGRDSYDVVPPQSFRRAPESASSRHSAERASLERDVERIRAIPRRTRCIARPTALRSSPAPGPASSSRRSSSMRRSTSTGCSSARCRISIRWRGSIDQYPRYAVGAARHPSGAHLRLRSRRRRTREQVTGVKTRRNSMGGWSQARYQRRAENFHLHHVKEVVDTLDAHRAQRQHPAHHRRRRRRRRVAAARSNCRSRSRRSSSTFSNSIAMPATTRDRGDARGAAPEGCRDRCRAGAGTRGRLAGGGLGVVGPEAALSALELGQVDELLIAARPEISRPSEAAGRRRARAGRGRHIGSGERAG